ncbi:MAG TPA: hypothetical protein VNN79_10260, partial [Actinomycetota bacterium]|nr:hypothetical protein [Actinomycetota bacterium]
DVLGGLERRRRHQENVKRASAATLAIAVAIVGLAGWLFLDHDAAPRPITPKPTAPETPAATTAPVAGAQPLWPQTNMDEVRRAQELADVGDPRSAWQTDAALLLQLGQHHPDDAEIFGRFLREELGWENFRWDEAAAHPAGLDDGDVVYIRCAPGATNPLYPDDPEGGCAPTLDDLRYETVKINVAQPGRKGPGGIWVVTGWQEIEPFEQVAPPTSTEIDAVLGAFLRARVEGHGAEQFDVAVDDPVATDTSNTSRADHRIPLLYATSTGAPFERSEFELVGGPVWPSGSEQFEARLFAQNGTTVVQQVFSLERDETGRLQLGFDPTGIDEGMPTTTENGAAVPVEYSFRGGEVTYRAAYPSVPDVEDGNLGPDSVTLVGHCGRTEAGCSDSRRIMTILADPVGADCVAPADADALARSIRSDTHLDATAPVPVTIGGIPAVRIDIVLGPDAIVCLLQNAPEPFPGQSWARLYLLDLPGGSNRVLAIVVMSSAEDQHRAVVVATPYLDSIEFHPR